MQYRVQGQPPCLPENHKFKVCPLFSIYHYGPHIVSVFKDQGKMCISVGRQRLGIDYAERCIRANMEEYIKSFF